MTYRINKSDPFDGNNLPVEEFSANGPIHPISTILAQTATRASTSLLMYGRGHPNYGERLAENMVHLLENFSGATEPKYPINGQIWACKIEHIQTSVGWFAWDATLSSWVSVTPNSGTPTTFADGELWFDGTTLRKSIDQVSNPLSQSAIDIKYIDASTLGDPNSEGIKPTIEILVYSNGSWIGASDVHVSKVQPSVITTGKLWYDLNENTLKIYVNGMFTRILDGFLSESGGTMSGTLDMNSNLIVNLSTPQNDGDSATKKYVDDEIALIAPTTLDLNAFSDVQYVTTPADNQVIKWNDTLSSWIPADIEYENITDMFSTGVTLVEFSHLSGLSTNIHTKFGSLDTQLSDRLNKTGDTMLGNLSLGNTFRVRDLPPPVLDTDASTKVYVDDEINDVEEKLTSRYVSLSRTTTLTIPDGTSPTIVTAYDTKVDSHGIATLANGDINLNLLADTGTEVAVKLTAFVKWASATTPTGIRGVEINGISGFTDISTPVDGFNTTQYITTGPISALASQSFTLEVFQTSGASADIEQVVLTLEVIDLDSA